MKNLFLTIFLFILGCSNPDELKSGVWELLKNGDSNFFVYVGSNTKFEINKRTKVIKTCEVSIKTGSDPSVSRDKESDFHAIIECNGIVPMGLRIKTDLFGKKHILGFWTENHI